MSNNSIPSPSTFVPVRVDVTSDDKTIRVVETFLMDPTCWPISLYHPLVESMERNIKEIAYMILSEAEVSGMGRTVRHFTGRVELWSPSLQTKVEDQLRPQLWGVLYRDRTMVSSTPSANTITNVSIRLIVHGIAIQEDILWDPNVPVSPFDIAQSMAQDLNLPDEAVVMIATTILEQVHGLKVDSSASPAIEATTTATVTPPISNADNTTKVGAWRIDPKEHVAMVAHVVDKHRQK